jgi:two-component system sensor histidine kinase YesM
MKCIPNKFNKLAITRQYFLLLLCSLFILLCLSVMLLFQARKMVLQTSNEYAAMFSGTLSSQITLISNQAESICEQLLYDINTTTLLEAGNWHEVTVEIIRALKDQKIHIQEANTSIADIAYVNSLINWSALFTRETLAEMTLKMETANTCVSLGIRYGDFLSNKHTPYLVFGAPAYSNYQRIGYIFISIRLPQLSLPVFQQNQASSCFLMMDRQFHTYAFNCEQDLVDEIIGGIGLLQTLFTPDTMDTQSTDMILKDYAVSYQYVDAADCYMISAVNTNSITSQLGGINLLCATMIAVTVLFLILVYMILYRNYIVPIRTFNSIIKEIEASHQRVIKKPLNLQGCKEIHEIGKSFTSLLTSINELNFQIVRNANDLYEMELQQKIAELDNLRNQINPHFIYNTLELIRGIATDYSVPLIDQISVSMGKILRYSIKGDQIVSLQQEIDITLAYLNIQQARFPNRIMILKNFQPDTLQIPVIKMLLQPLVENAIFHGLEPKEGNGVLVLNSTLEGDILKITIRDNGVGISGEKLSEIHRMLASPVYDTSKNIGLINTNARLHLQYGPQYGISLESHEGDGTCVTLILPSGMQMTKPLVGDNK